MISVFWKRSAARFGWSGRLRGAAVLCAAGVVAFGPVGGVWGARQGGGGGAAEHGVRAQTVLKPEELRADATLLRRALEELHPGLLRYNTREQFQEHFAALSSALDHPQTRAEGFLRIAEFTAKIRCGHTFPNPANQSKDVASELFGAKDKIPWHFRWIEGEMVLTRNLSREPRLSPGSRIVEVNGVPTRVIRDRLLSLARADGSNDAKRLSLIEVAGTDRFETFDVYYPLCFPLAGPMFVVRAIPPGGGEAATLRVEPLSLQERQAPLAAQRAALKGGSEPIWELKDLEARTACLVMGTWAVYDSKWDWQGFLHRTFDSLCERGVANLVIDLRGNEGGSSVGDVILSRLVERETPGLGFRRYVRYRKVPADLNAVLDTWDDSFRDWGDAAAPEKDGFYPLTKFDDGPEGGDVVKPRGPRYAGRVFVLIDASNSSATFEFALAVKQHGLGTLVGQPTGGNQRGINGGAFFFLRLPQSKLEVDLPLIGLFPGGGPGAAADAAPDEGVRPDVLVSLQAEDVRRGIDREMETVRSIIAGERPVGR